MSRVVVLTIIACFWAACWAYPTGPPDTPAMCQSMTPNHGVSDTASLASSYAVTTSKNQYSIGDKITLTISGNAAAKFKGFMVQVRQEAGGSSVVGTIAIASTDGKSACSGAAVIHKWDDEKASVSFEWTAPSSSMGSVQVWATVVQTTFVWTTIKGPIINLSSSTTTTATIAPTTTTATTTTTTATPTTTTTTTSLTASIPGTTSMRLPGLSACGSTKSCFKNNLECTNNCDFLLTWETVGSEIKFEMTGVTNGYIAVGFSKDQNMGDDNVIMCTNRGEVTNRYQSGKIEPEPIDARNPRFGLSSFSVASDGPGRVNCSFSRKKTLDTSRLNPAGNDVGVTYVFDLRNSYYLLLARGDLEASGDPEMHNRQPSISVKKVDFSKNLLVLDGYPPFTVSAAGLTIETAFIFRNSILGCGYQLILFALLIAKVYVEK